MKPAESIIERIKVLDARVRSAAKANAMARLFMTAPGVGAVIALSVASAYDDRRPLPPILQRRRLSRPDAQALRIRRDQPQRPHLEAREQADPKAPVSKPRTCC